MTADIVGFSQPSMFLHHVNSFGMIIHIEPVPHVFSVSVYRKFLSLQSIVDNQGNQLLRELIRPVIVRTVGNVRRKMIGVNISLYQKIGTGLACGIGTVGIIRRRLIEISPVFFQGTVYLICGNMQKFLSLFKTSVFLLPGCFRAVQKHCCSQHIGLHKHFRISDTAVHMAFCCKMHHPVNVIFLKYSADTFFVTDISFYKSIVVSGFHFF